MSSPALELQRHLIRAMRAEEKDGWIVRLGLEPEWRKALETD